ncbi:MAG: hypothetical protein WCE38_03865 [Burkholderiales bacterium]
MKTFTALAAILTVLTAPTSALAQSKAEATAVKAVQITAARKANAALMREYTWHSRIELIHEGQVKDTRIDQVRYGPDGKLERTVLNDKSARLPIGFLRRAIMENERQQVETFLKGLNGLLEQYTLPTAGKVLDFMSQARVTGPDASGDVEMTGHGVVVPGDTFSVWSDARTHQTRKVQVASTFNGDVVNLTATFHTLPSRLTYVAYAEVTVPAKQMDLKVHNFDFTRRESTSAAAAPPPAPGHVPIGTVVSILPTGCVATEIRGVQYFKCASGDYYRAAVQGNSLVYMATTP